MPGHWERSRENSEWEPELQQGTASVQCENVAKCMMLWISKEMQWAVS